MPSDSTPPPAIDRVVIGVAGRIGAGKTSAATYLSSKYGFQYLRYSQVLSDWLAKDPERKARLQDIGWEVMSGGMQSELNSRLVAQIVPGANVAVDGLRHPIDYESLKKHFASSFHLLYIDSPRTERWARLKAQGRYSSLELFEAADAHAVEQSIELLNESAAVVLQNSGSLQDLYASLDEVIRKIRSEGHA
jgi:dephospho-CoA kinase